MYLPGSCEFSIIFNMCNYAECADIFLLSRGVVYFAHMLYTYRYYAGKTNTPNRIYDC